MRVGLLAADMAGKHGWAQYGAGMMAALARAGVELRVLTTADSALSPDQAARALLPPVDPMARGMVARQAAAFVAARASLRGCDLIHALIEPFAPLGSWIAGERPLFMTAHGSYIDVERAYPRWTRPIYRRAFLRGRVIAVSRYTAEAAARALPGVRVDVVANGVDAARFAGIARDSGAAHPPTLLTVGAVKARKGISTLIRAFSRVRAQIPDARLVVVGALDAEPDYAAACRALAADLGAADAVRFAGRVDEAALRRHYAAADVFALASQNIGWKFEGFGLALLEASAAGLPVVGSLACGAADAVQHEVTGLLVPQHDPDALAAALLRLLLDRDLARRMGAAGRAFAAAHTWDAAAARLAALYRAAL